MPLSAIVALTLLSDLALAAFLLRRRPIELPEMLYAGAVSLAFALAKAAFATMVLERAFLAVRILHAWGFLALPLVGLGVLVLARRHATRPARATAAASAVVLPLLLAWTSLVEPADLRLERVEVVLPAERAPSVPLRIGVLADLQCESVGDHERAAVAALMAEKPDLILIPGDLEQVFTEEEFAAIERPLHDLLMQLDAPLGVFFAYGNTDWRDGTQRLLQGTRIQPLVDETVRVQHGGRRIAVCGLRLMVEAPAVRRALRELEQAEGDDVKLVFAHRPDAALQLPPDTRVDLVVAGHTHGGQIRLPGVGPLVTLSSVPREAAGGGLHELGGTRLYVSRGIGTEQGDAPRIRFNCPPEVTLLTIR